MLTRTNAQLGKSLGPDVLRWSQPEGGAETTIINLPLYAFAFGQNRGAKMVPNDEKLIPARTDFTKIPDENIDAAIRSMTHVRFTFGLFTVAVKMV